MKILLVDRSNSWRSLEVQCLHETGLHDVIAVETELEAQSELRTGDVDVLFVDINWNGPAPTQAITAFREINTDIPIIILMNESDRCHIVEAMRAGANDYLVKPCRPIRIQEKAKRWARCPH